MQKSVRTAVVTSLKDVTGGGAERDLTLPPTPLLMSPVGLGWKR